MLLAYQETTISRKEVSVSGSFSPGMRIDAALVANTSWLRAILWSFVLALREETLKSIGFNPLPIMVLDDPQVTFDPRNKRKWAQELVRSANLPTTDLLSSQLIITTHERSFYQMMVEHEKFDAQQGLIGAVNKISSVATIASGGELGRVGDGVITVTEWATGEEIILPNHDVFQLAAGTLDPVAGVGDLIIVSNYAKVNARNLVAAVSGSMLLARRLNRPENHGEIAILTGQSVDPYAIPEPVIVSPDTRFRKIVGTLFASHLLPTPPIDPEREFTEIPIPDILDRTVKGARLFKVQGRSAEPIALEGQFLITCKEPVVANSITVLDGRLAVAIDEDGARYFKRLRCHDKLVVLESLNPDGLTSAELLSLDGSHSFPRLTEALEVLGVLFELPNHKAS